MANVETVDIHLGTSNTGLTLTKAFTNSDGTNNSGGSVTFTEVGNGHYNALVTWPAAFLGWLYVKNGSTVLGTVAYNAQEQDPATAVLGASDSGYSSGTIGYDIAHSSGGSASDPLNNTDSTYSTPGTVGYRIVHDLDVAVSTRVATGAVQVQVVSVVSQTGDIHLISGDDYGPTPTNLQRITITLAASTVPDLTGGTVTFDAPGLAGSPLAGVLVTTGAGVAQTIALDLTRTQTLLMTVGDYAYRVRCITASGSKHESPVSGTIHVRS